MNQEYPYKKGWRIPTLIFTLLCVGGGIYFFTEAFQKQLIFNFIIGFILLMLGIYVMLDNLRKKVNLFGDHISYTNSYHTKELFYNNIRGVRITNKLITIEALNGKPISIPDYRYLANNLGLIEYLEKHFKNLDESDYEAEENEILNDPDIGFDIQDREHKLQSAKKLSGYFNYAGIGIGLWVMIYPHPYDYALITAILFPITSVFLLYKFKHIISAIGDEKSPRPNLNTALSIPALGLFLRTLIDYDLLNYTAIILPICLLICICSFIFFAVLPRKSKDKFLWAIMAICSIPYCYGLIVGINCNFDYSRSNQFKTIIIDKYESHGKSTTYYLTLSAWGPKTESYGQSVSHSFYLQQNKNDTVTAYVKSGYLHIPWYFIDK